MTSLNNSKIYVISSFFSLFFSFDEIIFINSWSSVSLRIYLILISLYSSPPLLAYLVNVISWI